MLIIVKCQLFVLARYDARKEQLTNAITFSGLLNVIDGVASQVYDLLELSTWSQHGKLIILLSAHTPTTTSTTGRQINVLHY